LVSPVVSVALPRVTMPPLAPPPASEKIVWLLLLRFRAAVEMLARVTAEPEERVLAAPVKRVPALIVVAPV